MQKWRYKYNIKAAAMYTVGTCFDSRKESAKRQLECGGTHLKALKLERNVLFLLFFFRFFPCFLSSLSFILVMI